MPSAGLEPVAGWGERLASPEGEVVELAFLLPAWEVAALEELARGRGLSTGQLLRGLVRDALRDAAQRLGAEAEESGESADLPAFALAEGDADEFGMRGLETSAALESAIVKKLSLSALRSNNARV